MARRKALDVSGYFMEIFRKFMLGSLGLLYLTCCNTGQVRNGTTKSTNSLIGEWEYTNTIWYTSELTLEENGTFRYHDQGCYGQRFSLGQWVNNNDTILLTSFNSFKPKDQAETEKPNVVADQKKIKHKLKKGEVEYSFVGFKELPPMVFPGLNDTVRVYFNDIQLQLRNDTLYCVDSNKFPEEAKFYRAKNKNNR